MHVKSFILVAVLITVTIVGFLWGRYETLLPVWFLVGLFCVSAVSLLASLSMSTNKLLALLATSLLVAALDEYLHVSAGVYEYFDHGTPSSISVFGTSLLMILILVIAKRLSSFLVWKSTKGVLGTVPVLLSVAAQIALASVEGYLPYLMWPVIFLYVVMGVGSVVYAYKHPLGWNVSLMVSGMAAGATMEFVGSFEGMWSFRFSELLPVFMIFTWALRTWTVHAFCLLLGVDLASQDN